MEYQKASIYFASGTGNSFRVAAWLHQDCLSRGMVSSLIPIDQADPKTEIEESPGQLVALAFPTHGLLPPWSAIKFLLGMPFRRRAHFVTLPTRGCFRIGKLPIPGAAGLASFLPALLMILKGMSVRGAASFDMPVNMTNVHPPLGRRSIEAIIARARRLAGKRYGRLLQGRTLWLTWNNLWELAWATALMIFLPLFPVLYLLLGRFFMGKLHFANAGCKGCGACAKSCPNSAIVMRGSKIRRPYWTYHCEACLRCLNTCPRKAVEAGQSWGVLLWLAATLPLSAGLYRLLKEHLPLLASLEGWWVHQLVFCVFFYPAILAAYWIFSQLLRWKPLNHLFTYTTFTRLWRRYREPGTSRQDLLRGSSKDRRDDE